MFDYFNIVARLNQGLQGPECSHSLELACVTASYPTMHFPNVQTPKSENITSKRDVPDAEHKINLDVRTTTANADDERPRGHRATGQIVPRRKRRRKKRDAAEGDVRKSMAGLFKTPDAVQGWSLMHHHRGDGSELAQTARPLPPQQMGVCPSFSCCQNSSSDPLLVVR